jgi:hypothetical protein
VNILHAVCWLLHQPSHAFDNVWTALFEWAFAIVMPSHILGNVYFPLLESLIIWHTSCELLDTMPAFEASDMQSGVFFLPNVAIVGIHALLVDPTLGIFVLFTGPKRVVQIVL